MNKIIPIVLLFGGLTVFSGLIGKAITTPASEMTAMASSSIETIHKIQTPQPTEIKKEFAFNNVNGISLNDNEKTVIDKLGQPFSQAQDPYTPEIIVYAYEDMNIGFSDGIVSYVEVLVSAGTAKMDGISIAIDPESLKKAFGEPDFIAEDGIVFQHKAAIVKLFTDMQTHEVTSLHYYSHSLI